MKGLQKLPLFILLSILSEALAISPNTSTIDMAVQRGIDLSIAQSYEEALAVFQSLQHAFPEEPAGYFFRIHSFILL